MAPLARNAATTSCADPPSPGSTSMPPAQNRLLAKPARAAWVRSGPEVGQEHARRVAGALGERGGPVGRGPRRRAERRTRGRPPGPVGRGGAALRCNGFSPMSGNSLTPVMGSSRWAVRSARSAAVAASSSATRPEARAAAEAAGTLDLLEPRPRAAGQLLGERLDVPGATGRVGHPRDVGLLGQQGLGVAGDAARERRRQADGGVERQHGDRRRRHRSRRRSRRAWCAACSPTGRAGSSSTRT